jgi:8-oxo-dGTP pyrophosphatase MutT (NUDIX family)
LCLLFDAGGEANVVLTKRAGHLPDHAGEVSFPGGRLGPGEVALAGALREAEEEVGVPASSVSVLGELTPLTTRRSPALVRCFVATFAGPASLPSGALVGNDEVERVFWAPLSRLAAPGVFHEELWPVPVSWGGGGQPGPGSAGATYHAVPFFQLDEDVVWGATGRLLVELLSTVLALPSRGVPGDGTLGES